MTPLSITPLSLASRFLGMKEVPGHVSNPAIIAMLKLVHLDTTDDETPWCSAFACYIAWLLNLPSPQSAQARRWLTVGAPVALSKAEPGFDVVVLRRGVLEPQPGPEVLDAPGHVGYFAGFGDNGVVRVLGGNQGDKVSYASFPSAQVLGVRRLMFAAADQMPAQPSVG